MVYVCVMMCVCVFLLIDVMPGIYLWCVIMNHQPIVGKWFHKGWNMGQYQHMGI